MSPSHRDASSCASPRPILFSSRRDVGSAASKDALRVSPRHHPGGPIDRGKRKAGGGHARRDFAVGPFREMAGTRKRGVPEGGLICFLAHARRCDATRARGRGVRATSSPHERAENRDTMRALPGGREERGTRAGQIRLPLAEAGLISAGCSATWPARAWHTGGASSAWGLTRLEEGPALKLEVRGTRDAKTRGPRGPGAVRTGYAESRHRVEEPTSQP